MDRRGVDVVVNAAGIMILRPRTFATDRTVYASVAVPIDGAGETGHEVTGIGRRMAS